MIQESVVSDIKQIAKIEDIVPDFCNLQKSGKSYYTKCPLCGETGKGKGLILTPSKHIAKCFSCDWTPTPISYLMEAHRMSYPDALRFLADKYNIQVEETIKPKGPQRKGKKSKSFRDRQLSDSGLTNQDQKATIYVDEKTTKVVDTFVSGTLDEYGRIAEVGDDVIMYYYDLQGKPVTYQRPKSSKFEPFYRVRWQIPEAHPNKNGSIGKYKSPYGSGSHLYIPEIVRKIYQDRRIIKRLYVDEGEKKALKSSIHGMPAVGIMGIQNFGYNNRLPHELQLIIQACQVEEIVFRLDNDWNHLSHSIKPGQRADQRPWNFYYAVKNFRDYVKTLYNIGVHVDIYFAYIKSENASEKGVDDLLAGTFKGKEDEFRKDCDRAINNKDGAGDFIQFNKISTITDYKLLEFWHLHSEEAFAKHYIETLRNIPVFKIGKIRWKINEDDKLEMAQPLEENEQYWEKLVNNKGITEYYFKYVRCFAFLKNRGFGRIKMANGKYDFVHSENMIVNKVDPYEIRDYITEVTKAIAPEDVLEMIYRGGEQYLGPNKLSNIDFIFPEFLRADRYYQVLFFKNKFWKISKEGIEEKPLSEIQYYVWKDKINDFDAKKSDSSLLEIIPVNEYIENLSADIRKDYEQFSDSFVVRVNDDGKKCHFLQFLLNSSNFSWNKRDAEVTTQDKFENNLHFVNKMWSLGYLCHTFFKKSESRAVIAMDGKLSEINESNGGTGKSIYGDAIGHVIPQVYIDGTARDISDEKFLYEEVTEKTDSVFIDDVRTNFEFKILFGRITGKFTVQPKGQPKFTIPQDETPKIYLTTNNAINGEGTSYERRQLLVAFSDFYNKNHVPIDDFGVEFFDEWNNDQWNLFYNFIAECIQVYFKYPIVYAPEKRLSQRRLRQLMGEDFLAWADVYFSNRLDGNINAAKPRKDMCDDFFESNPRQKRYTTTTAFKKKIISYCRYMGFEFNPKQGGKDNKSGGIEYFTVADEKYKG